jgi:hypothetical protein
MNNRRAKVAATATVLGLGALGGVALETNQGLPAPTAQVSGAESASVVTGASSTAAASAQPVALNETATTRPPIVTRASGGAAPRSFAPVDD